VDDAPLVVRPATEQVDDHCRHLRIRQMESPMREKVIAAAAVTAMSAGVALAGEPLAMQVHESDCFSITSTCPKP
jgi:hypothetical protein